MDVSGAQELARRIEQRQALMGAAASGPAAAAAAAPLRYASIDAFDHMEYDESDVGTRPALRQWMAHHEQTFGSSRAPRPETPASHARPAGAPARHLFAERRATSRETGAGRAMPAVGTAPVTSLPTTLYVQGSREPRAATVVFSVLLSVAAAAATSVAVVHYDRAGTGAAAAGVPTAPATVTVTTTASAVPAAAASQTPASAAAAVSAAIRLTPVGSYNPFGTGPENNAYASRAADGKASTYWATETYVHNGFQKPGTGLVLAASGTARPAQLDLVSDTPGYEAQIRIGDKPDGPFAADSAWQTVGSSTSFSLRGKAGRYVLVWLRLPSHEGTAHVNEVQASGAPGPTGP